ncbi:sigma-70 family RNA polymerase sigma factor [Weeksellaceae bacterium TAE3-ERU29]|nr:sigma-70 family RNA polymerase sigma factor [Weeksellaceae bacterium TAE3-ERU29]
MESLEDSQLVNKYLNGCEVALSVIINRHKDNLFNFIFSKVYDIDIANDIFQDTFIKVIIKLKEGKYTEEGKFLPWLMRIAYNQTIDHFRTQKKLNTVSENCLQEEYSLFDFLHFTEENIESIIIKNQIEEDVLRLIDVLPNEQREVLELRIFKGLSFKEIAEDTGVSINTALGRMRYAVINLRKFIEENNIILTP